MDYYQKKATADLLGVSVAELSKMASNQEKAANLSKIMGVEFGFVGEALNFAVNKSKYVIVYCHVDEKIEKQHLFSLNKEFLNFLKKKKIYTIELTKIINKKSTSPELYFL